MAPLTTGAIKALMQEISQQRAGRGRYVRGGENIISTGGTKIPSAVSGNGYTYHVFTSGPSSFQVQNTPSTFAIQFIVVGGGGGGGWDVGGGGGGGGIAYSSSYPLPSVTSATYPVVVGSPGAGSSGQASSTGPSAPSGTDSVLTIGANAITGKGGGGGGNYNAGSGAPGGSGGGASGYTSPGSPGPANQPSQPTFGGLVTNYGYAGGPSGGSGPGYTGGGGGGSDGVGSTGINNIGANTPGGPARTFPAFAGPIISPAIPAPSVPVIGPTGLYAGGGSGGGDSSPYSTSPLPDNTGFGGSGAGSAPNAGQPGSSGIVIIRYSTTTVTYRYWRLYKTNSAGSAPWHNEVQWTEAGAGTYYQGTNYQNWSHSGLNSFTAAYVTNGNTSQNAFHTDTAGVGSYALLDLGAGNEKYFNKVEIWLSGTGVVAIWDIQASNDNITWDTLYSGLNVNAYTNIAVTW